VNAVVYNIVGEIPITDIRTRQRNKLQDQATTNKNKNRTKNEGQANEIIVLTGQGMSH
jgi:hypothetical protein